jgi:hypothetical protein
VENRDSTGCRKNTVHFLVDQMCEANFWGYFLLAFSYETGARGGAVG